MRASLHHDKLVIMKNNPQKSKNTVLKKKNFLKALSYGAAPLKNIKNTDKFIRSLRESKR